jgi:hypothetical protein
MRTRYGRSRTIYFLIVGSSRCAIGFGNFRAGPIAGQGQSSCGPEGGSLVGGPMEERHESLHTETGVETFG